MTARQRQMSETLVPDYGRGKTCSMNPVVAALALVVGVALLTLMGLTATGERRRGHGIPVVLAAGIFFPITWVVWYLRDQHPYRVVHRL